MGTSVSFRAPAAPRWQAFTTALQLGLPLERIQSELFNAGRDWEDELGGPAVAAYAIAVFHAHGSLPDRMRAAERPEQALQQLASEVRTASEAEPGTPAASIAERAFIGLLTRVAGGNIALSESQSDDAAERFTQGRGTPGDLVANYVGELLSQYARHVTARETGRLTEGEAGLSVAATRRLMRELAAQAEQVGHQAGLPVPEGDAIRAGWSPLIREAFARGRRLPETDA
jgi:hypothetical protein